jgi:hypothetical protein
MGTELSTEDTLSSQTEAMETETTVLGKLVYVELAAGVLITFYGIYGYLTSGSMAWVIVGGIALFFAVSHYMKTDEIQAQKSKVESGRSGEEFVSKVFRENLPDDVYILNDVDVHDGSKTAQNDHILVHRSGIYLVETKTYGGKLEGHAEDEKWTQTKSNNGSTSRQSVTNPIQQNQYHREVFERFLENEGIDIDERDIHTYVAMVVKQADWSIKGDASSVDYAWVVSDRIEDNLSRERITEDQMRKLLIGLDVSPPAELRN